MVGSRGRLVRVAMAACAHVVIVAACSVAMLMHRVGIAGDKLATAPGGALLARFDLAVPSLIALVAFVGARRSLAGRTAVTMGLGVIPAMYVGWFLTIVFVKAALPRQAIARRNGPRRSLLPWRRTPLTGLARAVAADDRADRGVDAGSRCVRAAAIARTGQWLVPVSLAVVAFVVPARSAPVPATTICSVR